MTYPINQYQQDVNLADIDLEKDHKISTIFQQFPTFRAVGEISFVATVLPQSNATRVTNFLARH
jgi:hypothetical protein